MKENKGPMKQCLALLVIPSLKKLSLPLVMTDREKVIDDAIITYNVTLVYCWNYIF